MASQGLWHRPWELSLILAGWGAIAPVAAPAIAQIQPDTTLGVEQSIVTPNVDIKDLPADLIEGGAIRDTNLFHSFLEFNVGEGGRVYFANPAGIDTIFSRVTGNDISNILGTLGVNGQASLYLLNPNGIIFGEGARLDVPGSFVGTTANSVVFENGLTFSTTNPEAPPLLTVNVTPGLQYGNNAPNASITNRGNLVVGQDLTLAAGNLSLQGQVSAGRDLNLIAKDTVIMQDTISNPFIAAAGNQLQVEGANRIEISALNHANSGLYSGGDLVLRSANPIKGNAHYTSGGSFLLEDLEGNWGQLTSPEDPVIRASGDVVLGGYQGASLHILAGGSVTISGDVIIQSPDPVNGIVETVTLSDGTTVLVDGKTQPTLDIRAGTTAFNIPDIQGIPATGIIFPPLPNPVGIPTSADITIGGIFNPGGLVFLTNQYQPNPGLPGGVINVNELTSVPGFSGAITTGSLSGNGGSVVIDSRSGIAINGQINTSSISPSSPLPPGNGGDITLIGAGDIITSDILSIGAVGGTIKLASQGAIAWDNRLILSASLLPFSPIPVQGGDITIEADTVSLNNAARVIVGTLGAAKAGDLTITASDTIQLSGTQADSRLLNTLITIIPPLEDFAATLPPEVQTTIINAPGSPLNSPASSLLTFTIGTGGTGEVTIKTGRLIIQDGSELSAYSLGQGQGGNVTIQATDAVELIGTTPFNIPGGLYTQSYSTGNAGTIHVNTGRLTIRDGSGISTTTFSQSQGGDLIVNAADSIELSGTTPDEQYPSFLGAATRSAGDAGNLTLMTRRLIVQDGAGIGTTSFSLGNAGNLTINAAESVDVIGVSAIRGIPSAISTDTIEFGRGGRLTINTQRLSVQDGAVLSASTFGVGEAGSLSVNASESIELKGTSAGRISSGLYSQGFGAGDGNNIEVQTPQLVVKNGARITVSTGTTQEDLARFSSGTYGFGAGLNITFPDAATGNAGRMRIEADTITLDNRGALIAKTVSGEGGNINLQVEDLIEMRRNSLISAEAFGGQGDGGNIDIDTEFVVAIEDENSDIVADAFGGNGGNITITAQNIFGLEFRPQRTPKSDITASSQFGLEGDVVLNTPNIDPSRGLTQLPTQPIDVRGLVAQVCRADVVDNRSQFVMTGRGGLPPKPSELLRGEAVLVDWIPLASDADESVQVHRTTIPAQNASNGQIVEANGWVIDAEGNITLTASIPNATPKRLWVNPSFCD
ncbi:two-partner secretion domain-containing protein [Coleofasciculus sp. E2-BRE-01]|uniref:two-partner secretion domain-containing protein n=1 Tax=Coleofasciculus sp. E2-BRE-01 TaxID=3069524 RepID=UPI0033030CEF